MRDSALDAFDQLRVRHVIDYSDNTASFLAEFQSTAASLKPDERIKLEVSHQNESNFEMVKAVLTDPLASKICALHWWYGGEEDVNSIVPLLTSNCPELASLQVDFSSHSAFDFVSSVLKHPSNKIKVLKMPDNAEGDLARFFTALGQSQVSALTLSSKGSPELCDYLAKNLLVRFKVWMNYKQVPSAMITSLAKCTRLAKLKMFRCTFPQSNAFAHLPKSITKLVLYDCTFADGVGWSFLTDSSVQELDLRLVADVDGDEFGGALLAHLRAKGLDKLRLRDCCGVNEILAVVGAELVRIKRLDCEGYLDGASLELIALTLQSPSSETKELRLPYYWRTTSSIKNHLVPALKHPNCNLAKLTLFDYFGHYGAGAKAVEDTFHSRCALFVLLQGQQVRKRYCPLKRLPVEMFRLVGAALI